MKIYDTTTYHYDGKVEECPLIVDTGETNNLDSFGLIKYGDKYFTIRMLSSSDKYAGVKPCEAPNSKPEEKWGEPKITCPYCGYAHSDSWEYSDSNDECVCSNCGAIFSYERIVDVTYCSSPVTPPSIIKIEKKEQDNENGTSNKFV